MRWRRTAGVAHPSVLESRALRLLNRAGVTPLAVEVKAGSDLSYRVDILLRPWPGPRSRWLRLPPQPGTDDRRRPAAEPACTSAARRCWFTRGRTSCYDGHRVDRRGPPGPGTEVRHAAPTLQPAVSRVSRSRPQRLRAHAGTTWRSPSTTHSTLCFVASSGEVLHSGWGTQPSLPHRRLPHPEPSSLSSLTSPSPTSDALRSEPMSGQPTSPSTARSTACCAGEPNVAQPRSAPARFYPALSKSGCSQQREVTQAHIVPAGNRTAVGAKRCPPVWLVRHSRTPASWAELWVARGPRSPAPSPAPRSTRLAGRGCTPARQ